METTFNKQKMGTCGFCLYECVIAFLRKTIYLLYVIAVETFAIIRHVAPNAARWWIKRQFTNELTCYPIDLPNKTKAYLYLHGTPTSQEGRGCHPILLLHGDYSHPYTLFHLAKVAKKSSRELVFSLYIPSLSREEDFITDATTVDLAIEKIETIVTQNKGNFIGVAAAGHSKGGMLLAERQFCGESKISKTFCIAGPLKDPEGKSLFSKSLRKILETVCQQIDQLHERKFFQVIPREDWVAPYESMAVRPSLHCFSVPGMHLSGLYSKKTTKLFRNFLKTSPA